MATIVEDQKTVKCDECHSTIEYLPEEIEEHNGTAPDIGIPTGYKRVKCPRDGCPGYGYIQMW